MDNADATENQTCQIHKQILFFTHPITCKLSQAWLIMSPRFIEWNIALSRGLSSPKLQELVIIEWNIIYFQIHCCYSLKFPNVVICFQSVRTIYFFCRVILSFYCFYHWCFCSRYHLYHVVNVDLDRFGSKMKIPIFLFLISSQYWYFIAQYIVYDCSSTPRIYKIFLFSSDDWL